MRVIVLGVFLYAFSLPVAADQNRDYSGGYIGVGGLLWSYVDETVRGSAEGFGGQLRGGYRFNDFVGFEGRFSSGGSGTLGGVEVQLNSAAQFLATLSVPVTQKFRLGAYAGFSMGEIEFSAFGSTRTESDTGVSFGSFLELGDPDGWAFYGDFGILQWGSVQGNTYMSAGLSAGALYRF